MSEGIVYILSNPSFRTTVLKIGRTSRSVEQRAWEIYVAATGVPTPFKSEFAAETLDCVEAELAVHSRLAGFRINEYREFFEVPINQAKAIIEEEVRKVDSKRGSVSHRKPEPRVILTPMASTDDSAIESVRREMPPPLPNRAAGVEKLPQAAYQAPAFGTENKHQTFFVRHDPFGFWFCTAAALFWFIPAAIALMKGKLTFPGGVICFGMATAIFYFGAIRGSK